MHSRMIFVSNGQVFAFRDTRPVRREDGSEPFAGNMRAAESSEQTHKPLGCLFQGTRPPFNAPSG